MDPATSPAQLWAVLDGPGGVLDLLEHGAPPQPPRRTRQRARIDRVVRALVYERDGRRCRLCGSAQRLVLDHVIPHARGGADDSTNLRTLCWPCNEDRSDRPGPGDRPGPQTPVTQECDACATTPDSHGDVIPLNPDAQVVSAYCGSCGMTSPTDVAATL